MPWAPDYLTAAELKSYVRIPVADVEDDAELAFAITAASRAVDHATNRQFGQTALEARVYTPRFDKRSDQWIIEFDDIGDDTGLLINSDDDDDQVFDKPIDSFRLAPFTASQKGRPWLQASVNSDSTNLPVAREGSVEVTALFGWTAVPEPIKQATALQATRFFMRRNAPFGVAGSPEVGSEIRLLARLDPDVKVAIQSFIRWWGAA